MLRLLHTLQRSAALSALARTSRNASCAHSVGIGSGVRLLATKPRVVTAASIRRADQRSSQGIAPIDADGEISLIDDAAELEPAVGNTKKAKEILETLPQARKPKPAARTASSNASASAAAGDRDAGAEFASLSSDGAGRCWGGLWDDLSKPPSTSPPSSSSHSTAPRPETAWEVLEPKGAWQPPRKVKARERDRARRAEEQQQQQEQSNEGQNRPQWGNIKGAALPELGWAEARARAQQQQQASSNSNADPASATSSSSQSASGVVWSDAEFLSIFPHLRDTTTNTESGEGEGEGTTAAAAADAKEGVIAERIAHLRHKYPELEKLHFASTMLKVRKWRELLGATRMQLPTEGAQATTQDAPKAEDSSSAAASPSSSASSPSNALHHRYFQPDLFLTTDQVSLLLLRQRDLLYANIERVIVPRLSVLRSHLPGINLTSVVLRNPGLLLTDVAASLPLKLRELRALFPEVQLVSLVERDASILSRSASSHLVPRLNLFASVTGYAPHHVVQFLAVEHPQVLALRWNRIKRIEIVREEKFWMWWEKQQQQQQQPQQQQQQEQAGPASTASDSTNTAATTEATAAQTAESSAQPSAAPTAEASASDATAASAPASDTAAAPSTPTPSSPKRDPSSLPFSVYFDLLTWDQSRFDAEFPWWSLQYSRAEQEIFAAQQNAARETRERKQADDRGKTLPQAAPGTSARQALSTVSASVLASVPGNPQPLSLALGLTPDSSLSRDELRAKQRMDYLALKAAKREAKEAAKAEMRMREREHQQKKMREYTEKFQRFRQTVLSREAHIEGTPEPHQIKHDDAGRDAAPPSSTSSSSFTPSTSPSSPSPSSRSPPSRKPNASLFDESSYPEMTRKSGTQYAPPRNDYRGGGGGGGGYNSSRSSPSSSSSFQRSDRRSDDAQVDSFLRSSRSSGGGRDRREGSESRDRARGGSRDGFVHSHQKNRAGDAMSRRHSAHAQGTVERFGARPVAFTPEGKQLFGSTTTAPAPAAASKPAATSSAAPPPRSSSPSPPSPSTPRESKSTDGSKSESKPAPRWRI